MQAATPSLPFAPVPPGHFTVLSTPMFFSHVLSYAAVNFVKFFVVPEESERWHVSIVTAGSLAPGLAEAIFGSFHLVTRPAKMSATVGPSSFRPVSTPGRL